MEAPLTEIITQVTTYQEEVGVIIISLTVQFEKIENQNVQLQNSIDRHAERQKIISNKCDELSQKIKEVEESTTVSLVLSHNLNEIQQIVNEVVEMQNRFNQARREFSLKKAQLENRKKILIKLKNES